MADDTRECPRCAETIKARALVCRFCGHDLQAASAPSAAGEPAAPPPRKRGFGRKLFSFFLYLILFCGLTALGWFLEKEGYIAYVYNRITAGRLTAVPFYADAHTPAGLREGRVPYGMLQRGDARRSGTVRTGTDRDADAGRTAEGAARAADRRFVDLTVLQRQLAADPGNPNNDYNLGSAYLLHGDFARAGVALRKAVARLPRDDRAYANLAAALYASGSRRQAEEAALSALELNPGQELAQNIMALVALRRGEDIDALKMLQEGAAGHPGNADFKVNLGNLFREQGDADAAWREYLKALELNGDCAPAALNLGTMAYEKKDYRTAAARWKLALGSARGLTPATLAQLRTNVAVAERKAK